jgi:hypothetical protein
MTLSITTLCHYAECHLAECRFLFIMLSVVMLNVVMLHVVAPVKNSLKYRPFKCVASGQFHKNITGVTNSPSKISCTIHCMHAPMQGVQNVLAYFAMAVS